jgi:hypothetical protein
MNKRSKSENYFKLLQENQQLLDKIEQSRPLLTTIYDKVKRKEKQLQDTISKNQTAIGSFKNIADDYRKLYHDSIEILHKGKVVSKFEESPSNFVTGKLWSREPPITNKSKSVYEQYKERINRANADSQESKNPELKALHHQNQMLKNEMLNDIDKLRLVREKSQKGLRRAESTRTTNTKKMFLPGALEEERKRRVAQKQHKKLELI